MRLTFLFVILLLSSCSSYMNEFYRDLDRAERDQESLDTDYGQDQFNQYRKKTRRTSQVFNNPDARISSKGNRNLEPGVKREYKSEEVAKKRYKANDLTDNGSDGSLWAANDQNAFLFSNSKLKTSGDIIQINVQSKLRNEITMELKKNFPDNPYDKKPDAAAKPDTPASPAADAAPKTAEAKAQASDQSANEGGNDKISSVIIEEINRDHVLIRGRKYVLFKGRKRMVEVQALVARKSINDDDLVNSDEVIESNIQVVK